MGKRQKQVYLTKPARLVFPVRFVYRFLPWSIWDCSGTWPIWRTMIAWDQALHWGKKEKKNRRAKKKQFDKGSELRDAVGGERVAELGDMSLMPQICPPASNLSLKCQHVKFSPRMSAWAYYVVFVCKYLNSRWKEYKQRDLLNFVRLLE